MRFKDVSEGSLVNSHILLHGKMAKWVVLLLQTHLDFKKKKSNMDFSSLTTKQTAY